MSADTCGGRRKDGCRHGVVRKKPHNPLKESEIRKQIQEYLKWNGWFVFYHLQGGIGVYRGLPDLQAVKDGKTVYIEVKRPGGRQSTYQKRFQQDIEEHGGTYILARSVEDVEHLGAMR